MGDSQGLTSLRALTNGENDKLIAAAERLIAEIIRRGIFRNNFNDPLLVCPECEGLHSDGISLHLEGDYCTHCLNCASYGCCSQTKAL